MKEVWSSIFNEEFRAKKDWRRELIEFRRWTQSINNNKKKKHVIIRAINNSNELNQCKNQYIQVKRWPSVPSDTLSGCAFQEMQQVAASRDPTRGEPNCLERIVSLHFSPRILIPPYVHRQSKNFSISIESSSYDK